MDNYDRIRTGFRIVTQMLLNSKYSEVKSIIQNKKNITGPPIIGFVNKIYDDKQYNVIRVYAPTNEGICGLVDVTFNFYKYTSQARYPKIVIKHNKIISWINLDNIYIELTIESVTDTINLSSIDNDLVGERLIELIGDEAEYFYIRCIENKNKICNTCHLPISELNEEFKFQR